MPRIGVLDFDDSILDALRDGRLVVFAGAGVSMGTPASLPDFRQLASNIAQGTGRSPSPNEPLDRFLGQLKHNHIDVHERAAQCISEVGGAPNTLHRDLLKLFREVDRVRLVTTNFDLHFETAAKDLFGLLPDIYKAPALPSGNDFTGIIHLHGALPRARDLVLTDADFGRAYLTEGWARRFLVNAFRQYTVLFVGYSHHDTVMNYLARALPVESVAGRFALTEEDGSWELLGVKPIRFTKREGLDGFKELHEGVRILAERAARGALDWQSGIAELGGRAPPTDDESIGDIELALREVYTTKFLLDVIRGSEWLIWLDRRNYLNALFESSDISDRDILFVKWTVCNFVIDNSDIIFKIIADHGARLNIVFWRSICHEVCIKNEEEIGKDALRRWAIILLASAPLEMEQQYLKWLAERCAGQGCVELTLKVFKVMSRYQLSLSTNFGKSDDKNGVFRLNSKCQISSDHWALNGVWKNHLRLQLARIALPLLSGVVQIFEEMHGDLSVWGDANRDFDPLSYGRSAIEQHPHDQFPDAIDVLIDAARDALQWIAEKSTSYLRGWIDVYLNSEVPLIRRLAVHALTVHPDFTPEERLHWLLDRIGLHGRAEHHEVHRVVALNYKNAEESARKAVVDAVMAGDQPISDCSSSDEDVLWLHFNWLSWLLKAKPDCELARSELEPIKIRYPSWVLSEHPDLTHWMRAAEWGGARSPWSVDQILARSAAEQIDELLNYKGDQFNGPCREGLLANCCQACKRNSDWAFSLGSVLIERELWSADLWSVIMRGLQEAELSEDEWSDLLILVSKISHQSEHGREVANLLYALVRDGGKSFAIKLIDRANDIAYEAWKSADSNIDVDHIDDWLTQAINHPAGIIVEFWISGLSLIMHEKCGSDRVMPSKYRNYFTQVVEDSTSKGGMGRCLLASQVAFLFSLDERWVCNRIIPLFKDSDRRNFAQSWHGFLVWGRLSPEVVDLLKPAFLEAMPRLTGELNVRRREFINFCAALAIFYLEDPTHDLLPALFSISSLDDRLAFASRVGYYLRKMQDPARLHLWKGWLRRYWRDRSQGVYATLDGAEFRTMLEWMPSLGDGFPDAVRLACSFSFVQISHSRIISDLQESHLVDKFPSETAELLIYLTKCCSGYFAEGLVKIKSRLPSLPDSLRARLEEAFARAGL